VGADRGPGGGERRPGAPCLAAVSLIDDSTRPRRAVTGPELTRAELAKGQHLVLVHDMYREELARVQSLLDQVANGQVGALELRGMVADLTMRRTYASLGAFCERFCHAVEMHHRIEDAHMFPALRGVGDGLGKVLDRLSEEHEVIAGLLTALDARAVAMVEDPATLPAVREGLDRLAEALLSHLTYEEEQLVDPLGRSAFMI
jgi:iron-sulfur cluster repair protein YtfE (RIC family)